MNSYYTNLCTILEQAPVAAPGQPQAGAELGSLENIFKSMTAQCQNSCANSRDALCAAKCNLRACQDTIRKATGLTGKLNSIPDPKTREQQRMKIMKQVESFKQKEMKLRETLAKQTEQIRKQKQTQPPKV